MCFCPLALLVTSLNTLPFRCNNVLYIISVFHGFYTRVPADISLYLQGGNRLIHNYRRLCHFFCSPSFGTNICTVYFLGTQFARHKMYF